MIRKGDYVLYSGDTERALWIVDDVDKINNTYTITRVIPWYRKPHLAMQNQVSSQDITKLYMPKSIYVPFCYKLGIL